jgi:hypothetical protein
MQNELEPAFVKRLQKAADEGQVVLIPAPAKSAPRTNATPPLRDRDEAALAAVLRLLFELQGSEGHILAKLTTCDYVTPEELQITANRDKPIFTRSTVTVLICGLRKKLAIHNIGITTLTGLGYGLRRGSREKICRRLARYDAGLIATAPPIPPGRLGTADNACE